MAEKMPNMSTRELLGILIDLANAGEHTCERYGNSGSCFKCLAAYKLNDIRESIERAIEELADKLPADGLTKDEIDGTGDFSFDKIWKKINEGPSLKDRIQKELQALDAKRKAINEGLSRYRTGETK